MTNRILSVQPVESAEEHRSNQVNPSHKLGKNGSFEISRQNVENGYRAAIAARQLGRCALLFFIGCSAYVYAEPIPVQQKFDSLILVGSVTLPFMIGMAIAARSAKVETEEIERNLYALPDVKGEQFPTLIQLHSDQL